MRVFLIFPMCGDIYSKYSVLRKKAENAAREKRFLCKQLMDYSKIMDEACHSLALQLVNRREFLTFAIKFYSSLYQFRKEVQQVKEFKLSFENCEDHGTEMEFIVSKVYFLIECICNQANEVLQYGVQLNTILPTLSFPDRTAETHRQHIAGWLAFVEVERKFRLKELDQLTFKIHSIWELKRCEQGVRQSVRWLEDLISALISRSDDIGESAAEADALFLEHIRFKDVAEESFKIGEKLLNSAKHLRKKINCQYSGAELDLQLDKTWNEFLRIFGNISERLDLCQNFYRNIGKQKQQVENLEKAMRRTLRIFGEVRRSFVIRRYRRAWMRIVLDIQNCLQSGTYLLEVLNQPLASSQRVNLLSSSAVTHIRRTMSEAEKTVQQIQGTYLNDEQPPTESSTYVTARSPDTWRSTSISGVEDWCSALSEDGTTLDDFKSLDDDLAEEYISDDNFEDLPVTNEPEVPTVPAQSDKKPESPKEMYAAVSGVHEPKKYTSSIQPLTASEHVVKVCDESKPMKDDLKLSTEKQNAPQLKKTEESTSGDTERDHLKVVSPKTAKFYEPPKYSSTVSKSEMTDVKTEIKKSYEIKTHIKEGGTTRENIVTSQGLDKQSNQAGTQDSRTEKIHKIEVLDDSKRESRHDPCPETAPDSTLSSTESKAKLLQEIESLKSKYFKQPQTQSVSEGENSKTRSETISYGFSAMPGTSSYQSYQDQKTSEISRVVYSKEVTEMHSMTSISFQQQSFGKNLNEKWQCTEPQVKTVKAILPSEDKPDEFENKLKEYFLLTNVSRSLK